MKYRVVLVTSLTILLTACAGKNYDPVEHYLSKRALSMPSADSFESCRGYGCQYIDTITLTPEEWKEIDRPFKRKAQSARQERKKIIQSIAAFENIVGDITGTSEDVWGTFQKTGHHQQDCVDESTNTSIYMLVLKKRGHLKYHDIHTPQSRVLLMRWPHQTAMLQEIETGDLYAVDSWFFDNGKPPVIIDFNTWKKGWKPLREQQDNNEEKQ